MLIRIVRACVSLRLPRPPPRPWVGCQHPLPRPLTVTAGINEVMLHVLRRRCQINTGDGIVVVCSNYVLGPVLHNELYNTLKSVLGINYQMIVKHFASLSRWVDGTDDKAR